MNNQCHQREAMAGSLLRSPSPSPLPSSSSLSALSSLSDLSRSERHVPLYLSPVAAGFPSPADDYIDQCLDLHAHLVRNPSATFFLRAQGESMIEAGIHDGDLLVVDRSLNAGHNRIVIAALDGELIVKRLVHRNNSVFLVPANPKYPEIDVSHCENLHIWGVVAYVVHKV